MSYVALYRVWRPQKWADVVGQKAAVRILKNALSQNKLSHAYLFSGPRGTGKTSVARLLAKSVNCYDPKEGEPCNRCESCLAVCEGTSVDVLEIDAASNRGIDEMRSLREGIRYLPVTGTHKVYIIDEAHMLTQEAFNALLKTLEEPPEHVIFVLATTAPHKIPITIASRCQRLDFHMLSITEIESQLKKILSFGDMSDLEWEEGALRLMAKAAGGSMRDALSILDLCLAYKADKIAEEDVREILGDAGAEVMLKLFRAIAQRDLKGILDVTKAMSERGKDMGEFSYEVGVFARDLLLIKSGAKPQDLGRPDDEVEKMRVLGAALEPSYLVAVMDVLGKGIADMRQSDDPRLTVEMTLLSLFMAKGATSFFGEKMAPKPFLETVSAPKAVQVEPEKTVQPESDGDPLEIVRQCWPKILDEMFRKRKVKVRAFLLHASPYCVEGGKNLVLAYPEGSSVLMDQILLQENKKVVEEYIQEVTGLSLAVDAKMLGSDAQCGAEGGDLHPLVRSAIDMIDGKLVE